MLSKETHYLHFLHSLTILLKTYFSQIYFSFTLVNLYIKTLRNIKTRTEIKPQRLPTNLIWIIEDFSNYKFMNSLRGQEEVISLLKITKIHFFLERYKTSCQIINFLLTLREMYVRSPISTTFIMKSPIVPKHWQIIQIAMSCTFFRTNHMYVIFRSN